MKNVIGQRNNRDKILSKLYGRGRGGGTSHRPKFWAYMEAPISMKFAQNVWLEKKNHRDNQFLRLDGIPPSKT